MGSDRRTASVEKAPLAAPRPGVEPVAGAWEELRRHLEARFRQWCDELRHYPAPIARCDEQLPKLIEQRDHVRAELDRMAALGGTDSAVSAEAVRIFLDAAAACDDDAELALRDRLRAAASRAPGDADPV